MNRFHWVALIAVTGMSLSTSATAQKPESETAHLQPDLRPMIGKPLLDQSINFNNKWNVVLEQLTPEGARFFFGGQKNTNENADDMRQNHDVVVLITPCPGVHDLTAKVASVAMWETLGTPDDPPKVLRSATIIEQLLSLVNTPPSVVTPSTLRVPRVKDLHGPVFEYVRGDTTETLSFVNEGSSLRINWSVNNTAACPH